MKPGHLKLAGGPIVCLLLLLTGCATGVKLQVEGEVPTPLVTQIPLTIGIHYNENFRNFVFTENSEDRQNWSIDNRGPRLSLFNQILPSMFSTVKAIDDTGSSAATASVDAIIEPDVVEMQVALPDETHTKLYEAWVKYDIKLYRPAGDMISQWQVTGYGKTPSGAFGNHNKGLNTAIELAMRDIGAKIALGFTKAPGVKGWLSTRVNCSEYPNLC